MSIEGLKKGEKAVLEAMHEYILTYGYSPYTANLQRDIDIALRKRPGTTSKATVRRYLNNLEQRGYIVIERGRAGRAQPGRVKIIYEKITGFDKEQATTQHESSLLGPESRL